MIAIRIARIVTVLIVLILRHRREFVRMFGWRLVAVRIYGEGVIHATPLMDAGVAAVRAMGIPAAEAAVSPAEAGRHHGQADGREHNTTRDIKLLLRHDSQFRQHTLIRGFFEALFLQELVTIRVATRKLAQRRDSRAKNHRRMSAQCCNCRHSKP